MYYYLSELYMKSKLLVITIFIIECYLYFYTEDLVIYIQNTILFKRSSIFIEYNDKVLTHALEYITHELVFDIFIDYQLVNNNWYSDSYMLFMYISLVLITYINIYELFIYIKSILYKHEILQLYLYLCTIIYLFCIDVLMIQYVYLIQFNMDSSVIYKTIEWNLITNYSTEIIKLLSFFYFFNIIILCTIKYKLSNLFIAYIIYSYFLDIYILVILVIKWIVVLEIQLYFYLYNHYLILDLKKNNSGICKGM